MPVYVHYIVLADIRYDLEGYLRIVDMVSTYDGAVHGIVRSHEMVGYIVIQLACRRSTLDKSEKTVQPGWVGDIRDFQTIFYDSLEVQLE
jgi:hypothetical protein